MRKVNHHVLPWLKAVAIFLLCLALMYFFGTLSGCNAEKKIDKAIQTTLTNKRAFDTVGKVWQRLNPCISDTTAAFIPGKDTVTLLEFIDHLPDTIRSKDTVYILTLRDVVKTKIVHDTTVRTVVDRQKERTQAEEIIAGNREISRLRGLSELAITTADKYEKQAGWRLFWLILSIVLGIASHFIKPKLLKWIR